MPHVWTSEPTWGFRRDSGREICEECHAIRITTKESDGYGIEYDHEAADPEAPCYRKED